MRVERLEGPDIIDAATQAGAPTLASAIMAFAPSYLRKFGNRMLDSQRKALWLIARCRTEELGGHVLDCDGCLVQAYAFHSCRHRSCPKCLRDKVDKWFEARRLELLPVPYFHVVFSVPKELNKIVRRHSKELYPELMRAAEQTLIEVGSAPENLGGTPAVLATLHTWANSLAYHLHVHCLVPAGAVDAEGKWHAAKNSQLAPEADLANVFRSKLRALLTAAVEGLDLPEKAFVPQWKVHVEQPQHGAEAVLRYLGRSLYRGPLPDYRIVAVTKEKVVFQYRAGDQGTLRTMELDGHEFLRRFLQHVWPDRVHKVRYAGLWSRKCKLQLQAIRQQLLASTPVASPAALDPTAIPPIATMPTEPKVPHWLQCPHCKGQRTIRSRFARGEKLPPLRPCPALATLPPTAGPP